METEGHGTDHNGTEKGAGGLLVNTYTLVWVLQTVKVNVYLQTKLWQAFQHVLAQGSRGFVLSHEAYEGFWEMVSEQTV